MKTPFKNVLHISSSHTRFSQSNTVFFAPSMHKSIAWTVTFSYIDSSNSKQNVKRSFEEGRVGGPTKKLYVANGRCIHKHVCKKEGNHITKASTVPLTNGPDEERWGGDSSYRVWTSVSVRSIIWGIGVHSIQKGEV